MKAMNAEEPQPDSPLQQSETKSNYQRAYRLKNHARILETERKSKSKHRAKRLAKKKEKYWSNPEKFRTANRIYNRRNQLKRAAYWKIYYDKNRNKLISKRMDWARKNRDKQRATAKRQRINNPEKIKQRFKTWRAKNSDSLRISSTNYVRRKRKTDRLYNLRHILRSRILTALRKQWASKSSKTFDLLGCTPQFFKAFLEAQFLQWMNWQNHGKLWTIDHIIPISSFDLTKPEEQRRAFHYSNCRPLERAKNIRKSDTMPGPHQAILI